MKINFNTDTMMKPTTIALYYFAAAVMSFSMAVGLDLGLKHLYTKLLVKSAKLAIWVTVSIFVISILAYIFIIRNFIP